MVNVYWVNNFSMTKLGGEDIGEYGDGYYLRLFSTKYSNSDVVVPSKLNVNGNIKLLRRLVGFANQLGNVHCLLFMNAGIYISLTQLFIFQEMLLNFYALQMVQKLSLILMMPVQFFLCLAIILKMLIVV